MTSSRQRQREAARAKLAREMAVRQEAARRRRQRNAIISSAVAAVLVVGLVVLVINQVTGGEDDTPFSPPAAQTTPEPTPEPPGPCEFRAEESEMAVDVGLPPEGEPREGIQVMTISTNLGDIEVEMDLSRSPCIAASFTHLAAHEFFDGTKCHRMFPGMLQCGDPNARGEGYRDTDGMGTPGYRFNDENLPPHRSPIYPAGTMAMANSGRDTNGSQFFLVYEDLDLLPDYSVVGTITKGMDILAQVGEAGHDGAFEPSPGGGHPNLEVIIESLRVSDPA